jgi:hypothetical protein
MQFSIDLTIQVDTQGMERVKREILCSLEQLFEDYMKDKIAYDKIRWELDYLVYPSIGSFLAEGSLTKEEGIEIFSYCEMKLKELKLKLG